MIDHVIYVSKFDVLVSGIKSVGYLLQSWHNYYIFKKIKIYV